MHLHVSHHAAACLLDYAASVIHLTLGPDEHPASVLVTALVGGRFSVEVRTDAGARVIISPDDRA